MAAPTIWRIEAANWFEATELVHIVDIAPAGTWVTETLPTGSDVLHCRFEDSSWVLWRTLDTNNALTGAGAFPAEKVVSIAVA